MVSIMSENNEKDFSLLPSPEGVRNTNVFSIPNRDFEEINKHFTESITEIRNQFTIAINLKDSSPDTYQSILRSQIVFLSSAFDFYMHELTIYGIINIFNGYWATTEKYNNINVPMKIFDKSLKNPERIDSFKDFVNNLYNQQSLTSFDAFKNQCNIIGIKLSKIADEAFYEAGSSIKTIDSLKNAIKDLYKRRNLIAHQFDRNFLSADKLEIKQDMVETFINNIELIVNAIIRVINEKNTR